MKKILLALSVAVASSFAQAELVVDDYLEPGDAGLVRNTETGNEWLHISYTDGMVLGDAIEMYKDDGWRLAEHDKASTFISAAYNMNDRRLFSSMMGFTYTDYALAYHLSVDGNDYNAALWGNRYDPVVDYYTQTGWDETVQGHNIGTLLYRNELTIRQANSVSVPHIAAASMGLFGLAGIRRRRNSVLSK